MIPHMDRAIAIYEDKERGVKMVAVRFTSRRRRQVGVNDPRVRDAQDEAVV